MKLPVDTISRKVLASSMFMVREPSGRILILSHLYKKRFCLQSGLSGASGKWGATSLKLERYTGRRSGLGRLP